MQTFWKIVDNCTGRRATIASFLTREQAELRIAEWIERDSRGRRPDCHEHVGHWEAAPDHG